VLAGWHAAGKVFGDRRCHALEAGPAALRGGSRVRLADQERAGEQQPDDDQAGRAGSEPGGPAPALRRGHRSGHGTDRETAQPGRRHLVHTGLVTACVTVVGRRPLGADGGHADAGTARRLLGGCDRRLGGRFGPRFGSGRHGGLGQAAAIRREGEAAFPGLGQGKRAGDRGIVEPVAVPGAARRHRRRPAFRGAPAMPPGMEMFRVTAHARPTPSARDPDGAPAVVKPIGGGLAQVFTRDFTRAESWASARACDTGRTGPIPPCALRLPSGADARVLTEATLGASGGESRPQSCNLQMFHSVGCDLMGEHGLT